MEDGGPGESERASAGSAVQSKRPASWAWPLILVSVAAIVLAPRFLPRAAEITSSEDSAANLVVLQIQARIIVAASAIDPAQASRELEGLERMANSDPAAAALAALHVFIDPNGNGPANAGRLLDGRIDSDDADVEFVEEVRSALTEGISDDEREMWRAKLGSFVEFLPARGDPLTWPKRDEIRSRSFRALAGLGVTVFGGFFLGVAGLILLIVGVFRFRKGTLSTAAIRHPESGPALLEGFAIFLVLLFFAQVAGWMLHWPVQIGLMIAGVAALLIWPGRRTGLPWGELRRAFGLHRGKGFFKEILAGALGYLTILPLAGVGLILTLILSSIGGAIRGSPVPAPSHPIMGMMDGGWISMAFIFLLASVLAPLVEEISFRGAFFGALRSRWSFMTSGLVTGLIFAVIHPQGFFAIPPLMAVGFGLALIREWRGSLIAPMTAHAINNAVLLAGATLMLS